MKILIVDDKSSARNTMKTILHSLGFMNLAESEDGNDAWFQLKAEFDGEEKNHFDLIISDVQMPKLSGLQLLEYVRNDEELKNTPFFIASVVDKKETILASIKLGISGYIIKPYTRESVEKKLKKAGFL